MAGDMTTRTETEMGEDIVVSLRRLIRATELDARRLAKETGLTASQYLVLQLLQREPGVTNRRLSEDVSLSQATVTSLLEKLSARGLIRRERGKTDLRRLEVYLTDDGSALLDKAPPILQGRLITRLANLPDWERTMILAALQRLESLLEVGELDAAPVLATGALDGAVPAARPGDASRDGLPESSRRHRRDTRPQPGNA
ncbi:MarR family winged helix-turn-helix transcriptional regulator [Yunchengibacter salinarum]|uniref:MarR family winged helix-turn-helix transcriptional regulator n=1 Tax=Yunchengibacter salinarum TaxID=3133399 RepID=UPI0035B65A80